MWFRELIDWSGPATVLGGAAWIAGAVVTALKPEGCIGSECQLPGRSMREGGVPEGLLFVTAVLLLAVGAAGVVDRVRATGRFGRLGRIGLAVSGVGIATIAIAGLVQTFFFAGDFALMPYVVIPAGLALVGGLVLLGIAVLTVLPRWVGALLIIGVLTMLLANEQNARILLVVPFGIAWMAVGSVLRSGNGDITPASDVW
jgi:hypothetical protein